MAQRVDNIRNALGDIPSPMALPDGMAAGDPNFAGGAAKTALAVNLSVPADANVMLQLAYEL